MKETSIFQVFQAHEQELSNALKGLSLPTDAPKVQKAVETFFTSLFESDGDYRQSLSQSEDYVLQAALQLLQAQQNITNELATSLKESTTPKAEFAESESTKGSTYSTIIGAGIGAVAGGILGTWTAVFGVIAGTAVAIYSANRPSKDARNSSKSNPSIRISDPSIDISIFSTIIGKICQSIDNLMETYRVQVKRVENIYTQVEKPSLLNECQELFNQLANVSRIVEINKENVPVKVQTAINRLVESLENYDLTIKDGKVVNA